MLILTNSTNLAYYYEWVNFINVEQKTHILTIWKLLLICTFTYLGYLSKYYFNGKKFSVIVIYVLQPILLLLTLLNIYNTNNLLYCLPIIIYIVLSINIIIFKKFLKKFKSNLPKNYVNFILITSTSLNFGYIGSSILIFYFNIVDVSIIVTLCSVGSVLFLFTIGFLHSSDNIKYNIKFIKINPIIYVIIFFVLLTFIKMDYSLYSTYIHNYLCVISFIYFKLGLFAFGNNFNTILTLVPLRTDKNLLISTKYILFNKYIILPIFFSLFLLFLNKFYLNLKDDYLYILLALIYCPVAFNVSFINDFFFEKFSDISLLLVTFITLIISITVLVMSLTYLM